jgi:hypothetical protein
VENVAKGVHNLGTGNTHVLKVALTNTLPVANNSVLANTTQIAGTFGYTTGGTQAVVTASLQTAGAFKMTCANVIFTAAGGSVGPLRYAVLYNDTPSGPVDPLISWWDYGSPITLADTETFTVAFDQANGVFTLT